MQKIGNGLGHFINKADNKGQYTCARIYVEVDLEAGMLEEVKLTVGEWHHYQKLDYEQFPLKCRTYHEHGHFQKKFPKAQTRDKVDEEGWKEIKKGNAILKPTEKKNSRPLVKPQSKPKAKEVPKEGSSSGEKTDAIGIQEEPEDPSKKVKEAEEKSNLPPSEDDQGGKEENEEHISLGTDSEGDSEDGVSESDNSQVTPIKSARGRKSKKKQREEKIIWMYSRALRKLSKE